MKLEGGQVAVITGAASGIGFGIAEALAQRGLDIVAADVQPDALADAVTRLESSGVSALGVPTDVRDRSAVDALASAALDRFGRVDVVCNNAGVISPPAPMWEVPQSDWDWVLTVNLGGVINGISAFVPHLVHQGSGHVVNTASMAGISVAPYQGPYTASKHAVVALSEALALELAEAAPGVGVTVVCPGLIATNIGSAERNRPRELASTPRELSDAQRSVWMSHFAGLTSFEPMSPQEAGEIVATAIERDTLHVAPNALTRGVKDWTDSLLRDLADRE
jgi:NAD(P)-dependent dehydrogenase (short-subunit alcohol dehydrogenase family)